VKQGTKISFASGPTWRSHSSEKRSAGCSAAIARALAKTMFFGNGRLGGDMDAVHRDVAVLVDVAHREDGVEQRRLERFGWTWPTA
jgi:hypothetical protein